MTAPDGVPNHHHRWLDIIVGRHHTETISANHTLTDYDPPLQFLDPSGANRDVVLPAEALAHGLTFLVFHNGASNSLIVKDDGGATILTIAVAESGMVSCNGTNWRGFMGAAT